jgi:hypothetical protein
MSNLWRFKQYIGIENVETIQWPALVQARFILEPEDFFERKDVSDAKTSISGETKFTFAGEDGRLTIENTNLAPPLRHRLEFDGGHIDIAGNTADVQIQGSSIDRVSTFLDWIIASFSQLLSVELGVYCRVHFDSGTIGGRDFKLLCHPGSYSIVVAHVPPADRALTIDAAVNLIDSKSQSYPRFMTCCFYYHHALRLLSPYQVNFPNHTALPEVILNLAKCVELIFPSSSRDQLKAKLQTLGYSEEEVKTQLISIIVIRNEFDVGHTISGAAESNELTVLRNFAMRSIHNVRALLRNVASKVKENDTLLIPLAVGSSSDKKRILRRLEENLERPKLDSGSDNQIIISVQVDFSPPNVDI